MKILICDGLDGSGRALLEAAERRAAVLGGHLSEKGRLLQLILQIAPKLDHALVPTKLAQDATSLFGVVPSVRGGNRRFQFFYLLSTELQVKDTRAYGILAREIPPTDLRTVRARYPSYGDFKS